MFRQDETRKKVFVGMSGGVDSSVSATLLKQQGYDVTGVFIKVWQPDWFECTWREDRRDAMRVAAHLGIPFITLDLEKEYKQHVVDYMINEYKAGRTPNPDVMCNKSVKFGGFFDWAMKNGADYVATGHYARIQGSTSEVQPRKPLFKLLAGKDPNKDQSYFLWTLTQEQLSKTIFPVGDIEKPRVRELARKFGLPTAEKRDSQGLCFIGKIDVKEFLSHYIPQKRGDVLDMSGKIIGTHDGAWFYTIGERHGFTITSKTPFDSPMFVIKKDIEANTITVSEKTAEGQLPQATDRAKLTLINWNQGLPPDNSSALCGRSRYREELQPLSVSDNGEITFKNPQSTLSAGQSLVIYRGEECLGGGIIV